MFVKVVIRGFAILATALLLILVLSGYKRFVVWPQITEDHYGLLSDFNDKFLCMTVSEQRARMNKDDILKLEKVDMSALVANCADANQVVEPPQEEPDGPVITGISAYSHKIRTFLFTPIIWIGAYLNVSIHLLYTLCCIGIIFLSGFLLSRLFTDKEESKTAFYAYVGFLSGISILMNGRILLAYLSVSILLWALFTRSKDLEDPKKVLPFSFWILLSFIFSNVSSGVNVIVLLIFVLHVLFNCKIKKIPRNGWILILAVTAFQLFWVVAGVFKNIGYYYKGNILEAIVNMLSHGAGKFFKNKLALAVSAVLVIPVGVVAYRCRHLFRNTLLMGFLLFLAGGLVGISVLTVTFIFIVTFTLKLIFHLNKGLRLNFRQPEKL